MTPLETLLARLPSAKKAGNGWSARCPSHDDKRASLSVSEGNDGTVLLKCFAGCSTEKVLQSIGLSLRDLFPPKADAPPTRNGKPPASGQTFPTAEAALAELQRRHGKISASWTYCDANGEPVGIVVRWDKPGGKDIRPAARFADGWRVAAMPSPRPLYGLPELASARRVLVAEGEKAADAGRSLGLAATTSAGGSQAANKSDWSPLAGKDVIVLPDNDVGGEGYAEDVARLAHAAGATTIRILKLVLHAPNLPPKGDLADVLADPEWCGLGLGDAAEPADLAALLVRLAEAVEPWRPEETLGTEEALEAIEDLSYRAFPVDVLPEPIRGFVDAGARAIGCAPSYLALPLLTEVAAAIGNVRRLELKRGWSVPPILWGPPSARAARARRPPRSWSCGPSASGNAKPWNATPNGRNSTKPTWPAGKRQWRPGSATRTRPAIRRRSPTRPRPSGSSSTTRPWKPWARSCWRTRAAYSWPATNWRPGSVRSTTTPPRTRSARTQRTG
jgi:hypothetical protein